MTILETERLRLEPWTPAHGALLARLAALPEVMRYIGTGATWNAAEAETHAARALAHWRAHGFGWRGAVERASGEAVGLIAINLAGDDTPGLTADDHEIGWWFDPSVWGRGYATEGGRAIVAEAFGPIGATSVAARVQPGNIASERVVATLGLTFEGAGSGRHGEPIRIYRLHRAGKAD
jgi:RimJ/RimL family protein N-acetyltransferase